MRLVSSIEVETFRSIRKGEIADLGDFTALAGLNNSGKSNLLRALNAFFTGQCEPGTVLDLATDYHRPSLAKKQARRIRVTVGFALPSSFSFRKDLKPVESLLAGTNFAITREWTRRQPQGVFYLNGETLTLDEQHKLEQFLQLINFRYIPNRVLPIHVISSEHQALRDALIRRLAKRAKGSAEAFEAIRDTSASMIRGMVDRVRVLHPDADHVRLATPTSWSEMVFAFGYLLSQQGAELEDFLQGSGIQSVLMLETLLLIDQDYFQKFGWRQASVWGIEEPESSLHSSLEIQIAAFLQAISSNPRSRLQVLSTTHSNAMIQYADRPVYVSLGEEGSRFEAIGDKRQVLEKTAKAGISRWLHPILYYPLDPVILVEGKFDRVFLEEAFRIMRPTRDVRVVDLEQLSDDATGGDERVIRYVRDNSGPIKSRASETPVAVVLDWDSASKATRLARPFAKSDPFLAFAWPASAFNPLLGPTFRGIERHYSTRLIELAESQGAVIARTAKGVCSVESAEYGALKRLLHDIIVQTGLQPKDLTHCRAFLRGVLEACGAAG
jgi:energy-coupling factor transporter ATP-binding protein EcfA2